MFGLPRGGVPVAAEVARALDAPLDAFVVRKIGVPGHEELAMGAVASGGIRVLNEDVLRSMRIAPDVVEAVTAAVTGELEERERAWRGDRPRIDVAGRTVIVVDDGLATGSTMRAAVTALRQQRPEAIVVAVPTAPASTVAHLRREADDVVCVSTPRPFYAVGYSYEDFSATTDAEVRDLVSPA